MKKTLLTIMVFLVAFAFHATTESGQMGAVQGTILKAPANQPIPGMMVSLVHPRLGRSAPSFTNNFGQFAIFNIPPDQEPYYLEVYWGSSLMFRTPVQINGSVTLPPIILR